MIQQLYNLVDSVVVGRFVGSHALAAVGSGGVSGAENGKRKAEGPGNGFRLPERNR